MKRLLTLIAAMTLCNAYGEAVFWFTDGDVYETTQCEDKNNITMPTQGNPQKEGGFRFIGWKEPDNPKSYISKILETDGTSYTPSSAGTYPNTWTVTFSWGTVTGAWRCSTDSGTNCTSDSTGATCTTNANPTLSGYGCGTDNSPSCPNKSVSGNNAKYCWCKLTDSDGLVDESSLAWVFFSNRMSAGTCASNCAANCGSIDQIYSGFRRAVFGVGGA